MAQACTFTNIGIVTGVTDGIVKIRGLYNVAFNEKISIVIRGGGVIVCLVLNIEDKNTSAIAMDSDMEIKPGQYVVASERLMFVPVGENLLGRIVNPLGVPVDGKGEIISRGSRMVELLAPSIISRSPVNLPLETGLKVVDSLIPIGHGQRELIIGDGKTGKTSIGIDSILNQKSNDTICIYVAIGQKRSSVARIAKVLEKNNCMYKSIIVAATASDSAALQFLAPYSGVSIAEYFMDLGLRALIIYDDLSKHAVSYRQLSLLLRRPPGREGFPGDVFYVHSRLLERAANLENKGSVTALPIIETIQSDVSAYVPTNVISITDGQIFLETELFAQGIRPSVSPGLSVSRVGSAAQNKVLKGLAGSLKLELAQFREVEGFSKLGFALDDVTTALVERGSRLTRLLVQNRFSPVEMAFQIIFLFSAIKGFLSWLPVSGIGMFESVFKKAFDESYFKYVLSHRLAPKNNVFDEKIINFFISKFSTSFFKKNKITL